MSRYLGSDGPDMGYIAPPISQYSRTLLAERDAASHFWPLVEEPKPLKLRTVQEGLAAELMRLRLG
jgi:hypothetical protein